MNSIIAEKVYENQEQNNTILKFFKKFGVGDAMARSSFYKEKGAKPIELLKYLIGLVFRHTNIYLDTKYNKQPEMGKNTIYRFLGSTVYDWCKLLYLTAMNVIAFIIPLTSDNRKKMILFTPEAEARRWICLRRSMITLQESLSKDLSCLHWLGAMEIQLFR